MCIHTYIYICVCVCIHIYVYIYMEKEMATHSSVLAWRIPGTEEPRGLLSTGSHRIRHDWSDLAAAAYINTYIYIYVCICVSGRCVRSSPCRVHGTSEMSGCAGSHWQSTPGSNTPLDAEITQNTRQSQLWPEGHVLGRKNTHINIFTWNNNGRLKNQKQQRKKKIKAVRKVFPDSRNKHAF